MPLACQENERAGAPSATIAVTISDTRKEAYALNRFLFLAAALVIAAAIGLLRIDRASAQDECDAWINGEETNGETIKVDGDSDATIEVDVPDEATRNAVYLEFFGYRQEVDSGPSSGGTWEGTVPVEDIAIWGVGLYKVVWESRGDDEELLCRRTASIRVDGFPLASVAGAAGAAAIVVGLTALTFTARTTINKGARWTIKAVLREKAERDDEQGHLRLKPTFSVSQTLLGTLWGLLIGGGTLATLQETALSLPTIELALELVVPFAVLGFLTASFGLVKE